MSLVVEMCTRYLDFYLMEDINCIQKVEMIVELVSSQMDDRVEYCRHEIGAEAAGSQIAGQPFMIWTQISTFQPGLRKHNIITYR